MSCYFEKIIILWNNIRKHDETSSSEVTAPTTLFSWSVHVANSIPYFHYRLGQAPACIWRKSVYVFILCHLHHLWVVLHSESVHRCHHRQLQPAKEEDECLPRLTLPCSELLCGTQPTRYLESWLQEIGFILFSLLLSGKLGYSPYSVASLRSPSVQLSFWPRNITIISGHPALSMTLDTFRNDPHQYLSLFFPRTSFFSALTLLLTHSPIHTQHQQNLSDGNGRNLSDLFWTKTHTAVSVALYVIFSLPEMRCPANSILSFKVLSLIPTPSTCCCVYNNFSSFFLFICLVFFFYSFPPFA